MILAQGTLLPDSQLSQVFSGLEGEIDRTRASQALSAEVVIQTCARLLDRLDRGELDGLLAQYATPQILEALARYRALLRPESLRYKLSAELGDLADGPLSRPFGRSLAVPLGTLLHITAGNLDGLPAFSALEGLLTGNVNILKLPRGDSGLSLTLLHLLTREEPRLAPFLYAFSIPSTDAASLQALARLDQEGLLEKLRDCPVCIGQGYQGQPGRLGVGRCTAAMDASQPGCPPTTMQMLEFLRSQLA